MMRQPRVGVAAGKHRRSPEKSAINTQSCTQSSLYWQNKKRIATLVLTKGNFNAVRGKTHVQNVSQYSRTSSHAETKVKNVLAKG